MLYPCIFYIKQCSDLSKVLIAFETYSNFHKNLEVSVTHQRYH